MRNTVTNSMLQLTGITLLWSDTFEHQFKITEPSWVWNQVLASFFRANAIQWATPLSRKKHIILQFSIESSVDEAFDIHRAILPGRHVFINLFVVDLMRVIIVLCLAIFGDHIDVEDFIWIHNNFLSLLMRLVNLSRLFRYLLNTLRHVVSHIYTIYERSSFSVILVMSEKFLAHFLDRRVWMSKAFEMICRRLIYWVLSIKLLFFDELLCRYFQNLIGLFLWSVSAG